MTDNEGGPDRANTPAVRRGIHTAERAEEADRSLARIRLGLTRFLQHMPELSPVARILTPGEPRGGTHGPLMTMSRDEALALTCRIAESVGANPSYANIIRGAGDLFGLHGYDAVSIAGILERSGVSRRTFYQYFRNKEAVFLALHELVASVWEDALRQAVETGETTEHKLRRGLRAFAGSFAIAGWFMRLMITEAQRAGSPAAARHGRCLEYMTRLLHPLVSDHLGTEVGHDVLRARIAAMLGAALQLRLAPDVSRETLKAVERMLWDMLLAPVTSTTRNNGQTAGVPPEDNEDPG